MSVYKEIISLLNARDQQAILELDRSFGSLCRSIASHVLRSKEDIDEVVSDTYLAVWNSIPPEQPLYLTAYISRITRNLSLVRYRQNTAARIDERVTQSLSELELSLPNISSPEAMLDSTLINATINIFLGTLSKTNRIIFIRRYYCMEATKDIAKSIGITDQSIRSRLLRMRAQLRDHLEKEGINI